MEIFLNLKISGNPESCFKKKKEILPSSKELGWLLLISAEGFLCSPGLTGHDRRTGSCVLPVGLVVGHRGGTTCGV